MKNLTGLFLIVLSFGFFSCNQESGFIISGDVTGFPDNTKIYLQNSGTQEIIDSTIINDNKFLFKGLLENPPEIVFIEGKLNNQLIYTSLIMGNEKIKIKADIKDFPYNVKVKGSKIQDDQNILTSKTKSLYMERDSLVKLFLKLSPEVQEKEGKEIWARIRIIDHTTDSIRIDFIKSDINTYWGVICLGNLKSALPIDTVQALYNKLTPELKATKYAKVIEVYLTEKISTIGDKYHDFKAINRNNDTIKFSDLIGKYILLDFTTAYCGPCIQSVEELKKINKSFTDSLLIVSFSGDVNKNVWLKSLERDSVSWISLWDGHGNYSETFIKYGIQGVPTFFLIDPKGIIIDKWVGYWKGALENKLTKIKI